MQNTALNLIERYPIRVSGAKDTIILYIYECNDQACDRIKDRVVTQLEGLLKRGLGRECSLPTNLREQISCERGR